MTIPFPEIRRILAAYPKAIDLLMEVHRFYGHRFTANYIDGISNYSIARRPVNNMLSIIGAEVNLSRQTPIPAAELAHELLHLKLRSLGHPWPFEIDCAGTWEPLRSVAEKSMAEFNNNTVDHAVFLREGVQLGFRVDEIHPKIDAMPSFMPQMYRTLAVSHPDEALALWTLDWTASVLEAHCLHDWWKAEELANVGSAIWGDKPNEAALFIERWIEAGDYIHVESRAASLTSLFNHIGLPRATFARAYDDLTIQKL